MSLSYTVCSETVFTNRPLGDRFAVLRELGIDAIELWGLPAANVAVVEEGLGASGCRLALFCGNRDHSLIEPRQRAGFLDELRQSLRHAARLGCSRLTILSDQIDNRGIPVPPSAPLTDEQMADSMLAGLREAAALAEAANVMLLLEPLNTKVDHPGYTLCHSAPAFELVRQIGSPRLKVLYDVYHMQIMEGNLIATMEANLDAIGHIHVADVPGRHEPGTGEINYSSVARMLKSNGYGGSVGLECVPREDSAAAVRAFQSAFD
jgi:hydroxypyruvate isomerase